MNCIWSCFSAAAALEKYSRQFFFFYGMHHRKVFCSNCPRKGFMAFLVQILFSAV